MAEQQEPTTLCDMRYEYRKAGYKQDDPPKYFRQKSFEQFLLERLTALEDELVAAKRQINNVLSCTKAMGFKSSADDALLQVTQAIFVGYDILKHQLAAAKRDSERLDWLAQHNMSLLLDDFGPDEPHWAVAPPDDRRPVMAANPRQAIDVAMSREGGNG